MLVLAWKACAKEFIYLFHLYPAYLFAANTLGSLQEGPRFRLLTFISMGAHPGECQNGGGVAGGLDYNSQNPIWELEGFLIRNFPEYSQRLSRPGSDDCCGFFGLFVRVLKVVLPDSVRALLLFIG